MRPAAQQLQEHIIEYVPDPKCYGGIAKTSAPASTGEYPNSHQHHQSSRLACHFGGAKTSEHGQWIWLIGLNAVEHGAQIKHHCRFDPGHCDSENHHCPPSPGF